MTTHQTNCASLKAASTPRAPAAPPQAFVNARLTKPPINRAITPIMRISRLATGFRANNNGSLKISTQVVVNTTVVFIGEAIRFPMMPCSPSEAERNPRHAMPFGVFHDGAARVLLLVELGQLHTWHMAILQSSAQSGLRPWSRDIE